MMQSSVFLSIVVVLCAVAGFANVSANRVIEWKRRLDTCDSADRAFVQGDTTHFIYAYNDDANVAVDGDVHYHGPSRRGSKSVKLFAPPIDQQISAWNQSKPADTSSWDILIHNSNKALPFDSSITGPTTTYWCNAFALPDMNDTQWIIRYESITPTNLSPYMHHLLVYECAAIEQNLQWLNYEGHCYDQSGSNPIPHGLLSCNGASVVAAWAVGGEPYLFPSYLGMPFGGKNGTRYVLVESHWNNPTRANIFIETSGMRFYSTRQKPTYETGILEFGHETNGEFTIPAQSADYVSESWCPADCTSFMFSVNNTGSVVSPAGGIRLVANLLHAHTTGSKIQLHRVNTQGVEEVIIEDNSYDFNFQTSTNFAKAIDVFPGETLRVHCHYNTMLRTSVTRFGLSTQNEMCLTYTLYYPRLLNTKSACLYANYSAIGNTARGSEAACGNYLESEQNVIVVGDENILPQITVPYQAATCTYNPPPNTRTQGPMGILSASAFDSSRFPIHIALDSNNQLYLHYGIDNVQNIIHFAIEYPVSEGWMGLGYGGNGGMAGSDINLGWIDNVAGIAYLTDRLATVQGKPGIDQYNDLYDIIAYNSTSSVLPNPPPSTTPSTSPTRNPAASGVRSNCQDRTAMSAILSVLASVFVFRFSN